MRKLFVAVITIMFVLPCMAKVYGPTKNTDHLWRIAVKVKPYSATEQQTMVAILRQNPQAFLYDNVNGLKTGYYLRIPSSTVIKKISSQRAINIVYKQNKAWKKSSTKKIKKSAVTKSINYNRKAILRIATMELQNQKDILTLQNQINNINNHIANLDKQYQTRLTNIEQNDSVRQANIQKTNQQVQNLNSQIQQAQANTQQQRNIYRYILAAMIAVILLVIILLVIFIKRCKKQTIIHHEPEQDSDYDFMGSDESIPSKLDLARTYVDMGDAKDATKVLQEVIELGNAEQQQEAKDLLAQIK